MQMRLWYNSNSWRDRVLQGLEQEKHVNNFMPRVVCMVSVIVIASCMLGCGSRPPAVAVTMPTPPPTTISAEDKKRLDEQAQLASDWDKCLDQQMVDIRRFPEHRKERQKAEDRLADLDEELTRNLKQLWALQAKDAKDPNVVQELNAVQEKVAKSRRLTEDQAVTVQALRNASLAYMRAAVENVDAREEIERKQKEMAKTAPTSPPPKSLARLLKKQQELVDEQGNGIRKYKKHYEDRKELIARQQVVKKELNSLLAESERLQSRKPTPEAIARMNEIDKVMATRNTEFVGNQAKIKELNKESRALEEKLHANVIELVATTDELAKARSRP
jgi:hypothetical protein